MQNESVQIGKTIINIYYGDIRDIPIEALVNSDDIELSMTGMLSKAILERAGQQIYDEARKIVAQQKLSLGDVVVTSAGNLKAKKILHAVTFDPKTQTTVSPFGVGKATYLCLQKADQYGCESIAFPAIGTGPGQNNMQSVSQAMIQKVFDYLGNTSTKLRQITFSLYSPGAWKKFFEDFTFQAARIKIESALPIRLTILRQAETNYYDLMSSETISVIQTSRVPDKQLKNLTNVLEEFVLTGKSKAHSGIKELGTHLYKLLFSKIGDKLTKLPSENLFLKLDDNLLNIPWEICHDGTEFLGIKYNIGRQVVVSPKFYIHSAPTRPLSYPLKILLLADPTEDLPGARTECDQIYKAISKIEGINITYKKGKEIEVNSILADFANHDLVHYAGHAYFDEKNPSESGWLINPEKKENLTASMMAAMNAPPIVFANACQSGTQTLGKEGKYQGQIFGMASGFLMGGIKNYIGTFTYVNDKTSVDFAVEFYKNLVQKTQTVGKSLRQARKLIIEKYGIEEILWGSYMLYGDPQFKLNL